jgi:alkylhydroperoxidase family enzyme
VATFNGCSYCLAGHSAAAAAFKVDEAERRAAQNFRSSEPRADAILTFTRAVVESRGAVADSHLHDAREAGLTDAELIEIVAEVALNTFTNYLYRAAEPELDFPEVQAA